MFKILLIISGILFIIIGIIRLIQGFKITGITEIIVGFLCILVEI